MPNETMPTGEPADSQPDGDNHWRAALDGLAAGERRSVVDAVTDGILSGWNPTRREVDDLVALVAGRVTAEQYRSRVVQHAVASNEPPG